MAETFIPTYEFSTKDLFQSSKLEDTFAISDNLFEHSNSNYDITTNLIYPSDLQSNVTQMNYMIFHINVNQDSKLIPQTEMTDIPVRKSSERFMDNAPQAVADTVEGLQGLAKSGTDTIVSFFSKDETTTNSYKDEIYKKIDTAAGFAKEAVMKTMKPLKRLKTSIMLYMPQNLGTDYGMVYSGAELGLIGSLADAAKDKNAFEAALNTSGRILSRIGGNMISHGIQNVAGAVGLNSSVSGDFASAINAATRSTFNPRKEQLFQEVGFRRFNYQFHFAPRTAEECDQVAQIIHMFKFHMHPEIDDSYFFYMYPSEFDIEYHIFDEGQNPYINKISSCALEGMNISYGPGGNWATLINGCPTEIRMSLNFIELQPLNKRLIKEGGY